MKKIIASLMVAAALLAPSFAGGDCCSKETAKAPAASCCAKDGQQAQAPKAQGCSKEAQTAKQDKAASCCAGKTEAKAPTKACQTCSTASGWMMGKPNADCKACQSASL